MPIPWTERLQDPLEEPLWAYGWIPKEPQAHLTDPIGLEGHGSWKTLEPLPLQPWQDLSVTIDATPTSADPKAQAWIYALCIHGYSLGALQRKGTIAGMGKGAQTKARALFQGLLTLAPVYPDTHSCGNPGQRCVGSVDQPQQAERLPGPCPGSSSGILLPNHTALYPQEPQDNRSSRQ